MSIVDQVVAAVTPLESEDSRRQARALARAAARPGGWLAAIIEHHEALEAAFADVKACSSPATRSAAQKKLAILLTGHAIAEEAVIYPALADAEESRYATTAYTEQAAAKMQMALLENMAPMSPDYLAKLEHIRGAVAHHMYEEENTWFRTLQDRLDAAAQDHLAQRYREEFDRYVGGIGGMDPIRRQAESAR